jgi:hypothetical protein
MKGKTSNSLSTALLIFAHSDEVQSALKPLAYTKKQNKALWHKMNERVVALVGKTKLPYFISDENTQLGDSFGDKLSHAIQFVFDKGYDKVIVLGNDSPGLRLANLHEASAALQENSTVLGSDFKGGAYLIGISKSFFNERAFAKVDWQTPAVFMQLQSLFLAQNPIIIAPLADCNTKSDFEKLLQDLPFNNDFKNVLLSLRGYSRVIYRFLNHFHTNLSIGLTFNKGSPVLV